MKQAVATSSARKTRRKSREELNQEARKRKRARKHKGNKAGSRSNPSEQARKSSSISKARDPRIGSKKPVSLGRETTARSASQPVEKSCITAQEELTVLENDKRLNALLDRLEVGEVLTSEEQAWLDETLDRIDKLMMQLGIVLDDGADEGEDTQENMYRLLKSGH